RGDAQAQRDAENALPESEELGRRQGGVGEEPELRRRVACVERGGERALEIARHDEDERRRSAANALARRGFVWRRRRGAKTVPRQALNEAVGKLRIGRHDRELGTQR